MVRADIVACSMLVMASSTLAVDVPSSSLAGTTALVVYKLAGPTVGAVPSSLDDNPKFKGSPILDVQVVVQPETIKQIVAVIESTLKAPGNQAGCFNPGMAVRFLTSGRATDVLVCLKCNNFTVPGGTRIVGLSDEAHRALADLYADMFHDAR